MIAQLYSDEMTFRNELRHGIQQYVQPLDIGIVTQEQHEMLFQNIEQVFDLLNELNAYVRISATLDVSRS